MHELMHDLGERRVAIGVAEVEDLRRPAIQPVSQFLDGLHVALLALGDVDLGPLYNVAEWMTSNWWALLFEPRKSDQIEHSEDEVGFRARHWLGYAREGFALPDLWFYPLGDEIEIAAYEKYLRFARAFLGWSSGSRASRLITSARTREQQGCRAFAAELLAPSDYIQRRAGGSAISMFRIEEIAADLEVSPAVVKWQAQNNKLHALGAKPLWWGFVGVVFNRVDSRMAAHGH
jgi:hypothetical protein